MALLRARAAARHRLGLERPDRLPFFRAHMLIQRREHHFARWHEGHRPQHRADRGRIGRNPSRDHKSAGRRLFPAPRHMIEQAVAPLSKVDHPQPRQFLWPAGQQYLQQPERRVPMLGQALRALDLGQTPWIDTGNMKLVYRRAKRLPQPHRFARIDRLAMRSAHLAHQPRENHLPVHRRYRGRNVRSRTNRIECIAQPLAQLLVANRHKPRHQQPTARGAHERIAHRPHRAIVGQQHYAPRKAYSVFPVLRQYSGGKRIGKGPMGRDGVDVRARRFNHVPVQPRPPGSPGACQHRTTIPGAMRHKAAPPPLRGSRRY